MKRTFEKCFGCEQRPQKYITGLCEECHQIAKETDREFEEEMKMKKLDEMTVKELRAEAKKAGVPKYSRMSKCMITK
jgi:hypothetical protein